MDYIDPALVAQVDKAPHDQLGIAFGNGWNILHQNNFGIQQFHSAQKREDC
jgi:hypothetical protein